MLALGYLVSINLELITLHWLLEKFFGNLFLILVVLFQGEIRLALAQIGRNPFVAAGAEREATHVLEEVAKSAMALAQRGYGALIVIEREVALDYFVEVGKELDSLVTLETLVSLFHPQSPLHDGAVIIRRGRLFAAGCLLPLSKNPVLDRNLGTRHRAALGLTEETDALVLVVSEEQGTVSVVQQGDLFPDLDLSDIRQHLFQTFDVQFSSGGKT